MTTCPNCQSPLRSSAHFCTRCGATLAGPSPSTSSAQADPLDWARQAASQVSASATPVVKDAASKSWQVSRRKMGRFASILTLGGRAAYTEVTNPQPALEGFVVGQPTRSWAQPVQEPSAYIFLVSLLAVWLLLLPRPAVGLLLWAGIAVILLLLAWRGTRRPFFSRLTFHRLWQRLRRRPANVAALTFSMQRQTLPGGPSVPVTVLGYDPKGALAASTFVRVYGIFSADGTTLRAWRILTIDGSGRLAGALTAPRLVPMVVALFLPLLVILPVLLLRMLL